MKRSRPCDLNSCNCFTSVALVPVWPYYQEFKVKIESPSQILPSVIKQDG